jgi:hypothetical protein
MTKREAQAVAVVVSSIPLFCAPPNKTVAATTTTTTTKKRCSSHPVERAFSLSHGGTILYRLIANTSSSALCESCALFRHIL